MEKKADLSFFDEQVGKEFINAVHQTFETYLGGKGNLSQPRLFENGEVAYDVGGMVQFRSHEVDGSMILAFEKNFVLKVYEEMLGEKSGALNQDVADCVGELTNTIYGIAKAALVNAGYEFPMARPETSLEVKKLISKGVKCIELPFKFEGFPHATMALILVVKHVEEQPVAS